MIPSLAIRPWIFARKDTHDGIDTIPKRHDVGGPIFPESFFKPTKKELEVVAEEISVFDAKTPKDIQDKISLLNKKVAIARNQAILEQNAQKLEELSRKIQVYEFFQRELELEEEIAVFLLLH